MGASALKIQDGIDLENLPSFHYLDRKNNQIYKITNCNIFKSDFKAKIQLFDECALIDLSPFEFWIAGGVKSSKKLSKKVFRLNHSLNKVFSLQSLPLPTKGGSLLQYKNSIFLTGAITIQGKKDYPCPLLRYDTEEENWEVCEVDDFLIPAKYSLNNILYSQGCLNGSKLYTLGGLKASNTKKTKKIFSVDLSEKTFRIKIEDFKFPTKFNKFSCVCVKNDLFVCGMIDASETVLYSYNFSLKTWKELYRQQININESYPPIIVDNSVFFIFYPCALILNGFSTVFCELNTDISEENCEKACESINEELKDHDLENESSFQNENIISKFQSSSKLKNNSQKKRVKKSVMTRYSKSMAPFLPSNIINPQFSASSSSDSSFTSDSESDSESSSKGSI